MTAAPQRSCLLQRACKHALRGRAAELAEIVGHHRRELRDRVHIHAEIAEGTVQALQFLSGPVTAPSFFALSR